MQSYNDEINIGMITEDGSIDLDKVDFIKLTNDMAYLRNMQVDKLPVIMEGLFDRLKKLEKRVEELQSDKKKEFIPEVEEKKSEEMSVEVISPPVYSKQQLEGYEYITLKNIAKKMNIKVGKKSKIKIIQEILKKQK